MTLTPGQAGDNPALLPLVDGYFGAEATADAVGDVHVILGVARRRVLDHGDLVAELGGVADGCLDTGVRDEADDDELVDPVFLQLQVQVGVRETA